MAFVGLKDEEDIVDLVAYLKEATAELALLPQGGSWSRRADFRASTVRLTRHAGPELSEFRIVLECVHVLATTWKASEADPSGRHGARHSGWCAAR